MANIVWDIDGVLVNLEKYLLEVAPPFFAKKFNKEIINSNSIDLKEMFNCTSKEEEMFWTYRLNLLTYSMFQKPRYGMKEVMDKVHENGDKNIICSARAKCDEDTIIGNILKKAVNHWIVKNELPVDEVHFVSYKNSALEKLKVCKKVNATVLIDDDMENAKVVSQEIPTIVYTSDYNTGLVDKNIYHANSPDSLYLEIEKQKKNPNFIDFNFLSREEREKLSYEELQDYYDKYRLVMRQMPYNQKKREHQEEKYNKLFNMMYSTHNAISAKAILLNPDMLENIKKNYCGGKVFAIASHTSLDDIQQVESIIDEMSYFLVKDEFSKYPLIGKFLESIGCIYVERDYSDSRIYARCQMEKLVLRDKNCIILPEGTRNRTDNTVGKFEMGAASITQRTGKYLVPIAMKRYNDTEKQVYLKICSPRKIEIDADLEIVTNNLENELTKEIQAIERMVESDSKCKQYLKK